MKRNTRCQNAAAGMSAEEKLTIIRSAISQIKKQLKTGDVRFTLSDLTRLMKLESEITQRSSPRKITVYWKDPSQLASQPEPSPPPRLRRFVEKEFDEISIPYPNLDPDSGQNLD
jgi:hypothetical protein